MENNRNVLILWQYHSAIECYGHNISSSLGSQMQSIQSGDNLYITVTNKDELFLLGCIKVSKVTKKKNEWDQANGKSVFGKFKLVPLKENKWKLRFISSNNKIKQDIKIAYQLQSHRFLTEDSAILLSKILKHSKGIDIKSLMSKEFKKEGGIMERSLSIRERDPKIREAELRKYGFSCMICKYDFNKYFGDFQNCVEIHHLNPIADRSGPEQTKLDDVIVVCPNCHRVIHRTDDPSDWKSLRAKLRR